MNQNLNCSKAFIAQALAPILEMCAEMAKLKRRLECVHFKKLQKLEHCLAISDIDEPNKEPQL